MLTAGGDWGAGRRRLMSSAQVRTRIRTALAVSFSGILVPFAFGCVIALWLLQLLGGSAGLGIAALALTQVFGLTATGLAPGIAADSTSRRSSADRGLGASGPRDRAESRRLSDQLARTRLADIKAREAKQK